jgi:uncharacterized protein (DUF952 family)
MILHITSHAEWKEAVLIGQYAAPSLRVEGFIHCSSANQVVDTANIFFSGQSGLVLLCIDESRLTAEVKFEDPTGGAKHDPPMEELFPHIYGPINLDAVIKVVDFPPNEDGTFSLPDDI